jgi:antitoxin VapB
MYIHKVYTELIMDKPSQNRVAEARGTFKLQGAEGLPSPLSPGQTKHYKAKVFKSGNSLALRLPAALGLEAGMEMELTVEPGGGYSLKPAAPVKRKFDIDAIWGIGADLGLEPIKPEDRVFDDVRRPWDDPDWPGWGEGDA